MILSILDWLSGRDAQVVGAADAEYDRNLVGIFRRRSEGSRSNNSSDGPFVELSLAMADLYSLTTARKPDLIVDPSAGKVSSRNVSQ